MTTNPGKKSKFERFHGAFTGGFSAGYFNTVGSENNAGFQPSTFVSSRSNRAPVDLVMQRKEHYMDDEDGLLGGHLSTKQDTDSFNKKGNASSAYFNETDSRIIPGPLPSDLIIVPVDSVGKKLLASMGWKQGHGVGPMQPRRISEFSETELATIPKSSLQNGFVLFPAPRDSEGIKLEMPIPKTDLVGLGYDVANENPELLDFIHSKKRSMKHKGDVPMQGNTYRVDDLFNKKGAKSIGHQEGAKYSSGFAYDEDVDEVYEGEPDRGSYLNHELTEEEVLGQVERRDKSALLKGVNEWLDGSITIDGDAKLQQRSYDGRNPLPGFHVSQEEKIVPPVIDRIEVPSNFIGKHVFPTEAIETENSSLLRRKKMEGGLAVVAARATILNSNGVETDVKSGSIFSMLSVDDQQRIKNITQSGKAIEQRLPSAAAAPVIPAAIAERPMLTSVSLLNSTFAGLSQAFRNRFVTSTGSSALPENIVKEGMATAAEYTAKISATIASSSEAKKEKESAASEKPTAKPKMFQVVRTTIIWAPAPLLCKRFNIKTPEISKDFAAINAKQDDIGVFDRLFPGTEPPTATVEKSDESKDNNAVNEELLQQFEKQDAYRPVAEKPPVSLFKSIFLDDSDSDSDSDSDARDKAEVEENAAPEIEKDSTIISSNISSNSKVPDEKKVILGPERIDRDGGFPEVVDLIRRDEATATVAISSSDCKPGKVAFVSKKDRQQFGTAAIPKGSGNLTFGSASFRTGKPKKALLTSEGPQEEVDGELTKSSQEVTDSKSVSTVMAEDKDEVSMKRRKHQLNSNKRKTATLSFDSGEEDPVDDTIPILKKKADAKLSAHVQDTSSTEHLNSLKGVIMATNSKSGTASAAPEKSMKPSTTASDSYSSNQEEKAQRWKNEAQANQFLTALLSKHTVHGDPDLDVPLPSYLTDALPPRPTGSRKERSADAYPSSSASSGHNGSRGSSSKDHRREQSSSAMPSSYSSRPPSFHPAVPPRADSSDEIETERKVPSFASLSQRLKAELDDKSRRKEEKKKHKEKKDKKDKKEQKKRSGSDSD